MEPLVWKLCVDLLCTFPYLWVTVVDMITSALLHLHVGPWHDPT